MFTHCHPLTRAMRARIDSAEGRALYERRFAIVEPVLGNIRHNKKLNRFTLRGRAKVDGQWKLFCTVHNIEMLARHGFAQEARSLGRPSGHAPDSLNQEAVMRSIRS